MMESEITLVETVFSWVLMLHRFPNAHTLFQTNVCFGDLSLGNLIMASSAGHDQIIKSCIIRDAIYMMKNPCSRFCITAERRL